MPALLAPFEALWQAVTRPPFTEKQGQYLVFIHLYTKINGQPPAQTDMARYFRVEASSVHRMVVTLEQKGLISRQSRVPRSLQVLLPREDLPPLR